MGASLALFVNSFDGNSDVWDTFFDIYDRFMPDSSIKRYLVTNTREFNRIGITVIQTGNDTNWFVMTLKALEQIEESYVFHVLEDQFVSRKLSDDVLLGIVERMETEDLYYYRMTATQGFESGASFIKVPQNTPYPISLQPAIWRRDVFMDILKRLYSAGCRTPWDFERHFIEKYRDGNRDMYLEGVRYDSRDLMGYQNALIQGKWDPRVIGVYRRLGINIDPGERGLMSRPAVLFDALKRNKLVRSMSYENRQRLKALLKRLGFKFMT